MRHKYARRNTKEYLNELQELNKTDSPETPEKDGKNIFNVHPREYYQSKRNQEKRKIIAEKERQKTGAKKPLDAALDKLKDFQKSEFNESWFFEDDMDLNKSEIPAEEGVKHPEYHKKPWVSKIHPNGIMMWHSSPEHAKNIDGVVREPANHKEILDNLPKTHRQAYKDMVNQTMKDPNRHFIPTEEDGSQKVRARHLKALLLGSSDVQLDTKDPNRLTLRRNSHTQGRGDKTISIHFPTKKEKV